MRPVHMFAGYSLRCVLFYRDIDDSEAYCTSGSIYGRPAWLTDYRRKSFEVLGAVDSGFMSQQSHNSVSGQYRYYGRSRLLVRHSTGLKRPKGCISGTNNLYDAIQVCLCYSMPLWFVQSTEVEALPLSVAVSQDLDFVLLSESSASSDFGSLRWLQQHVIFRLHMDLYSSVCACAFLEHLLTACLGCNLA